MQENCVNRQDDLRVTPPSMQKLINRKSYIARRCDNLALSEAGTLRNQGLTL